MRCRVGFFAFVPLAAFASMPFAAQEPFFEFFVNAALQFRRAQGRARDVLSGFDVVQRLTHRSCGVRYSYLPPVGRRGAATHFERCSFCSRQHVDVTQTLELQRKPVAQAPLLDPAASL
jgi:hypothetical protein